MTVCALLAAGPAGAVDPFEIQVYDATSNKPGQPGLEVHFNAVASGLTRADAPELPQNHQLHFTFEPSIGITPWWELGGYVQTALTPDGVFRYAGVKLRSKFVTPPSESRHARLGINFELDWLPPTFDAGRFGAEIRPIAAWENEHWALAVNPIIDFEFAGAASTLGPTLEPAASVVYKIADAVGFGVEYYGNWGPMARFSPVPQQEHYVFEVAELLAVHNLELSAGVGEGLTRSSNRLVVKAIVGYVLP